MKVLWITDSWTSLDHERDTSLRIMEASLAGPVRQRVFWADYRTIRLVGDRVFVDALEMSGTLIKKARRGAQLDEPGGIKRRQPSEFSQIHYRVDPPVDESYLHPLLILATGLRGTRSELVNPVEVLAAHSEKLEPAFLDHFAPPGVVSSRPDVLMDFLKKERTAILKPLHQAQSKGVKKLCAASSAERSRALRELGAATHGFSRPVLLQRFLPSIETDGEIRLWFVDGKLLAAVKKLPARGTYRIDMDHGARVEPVILAAREVRASHRIGKHLRTLGVRLAAVDLIDGFITDFNLTSPGLIVQMEQVLRRNLAAEVVRKLSRKR